MLEAGEPTLSLEPSPASTTDLDLAVHADALDDTLEALKRKGYHVTQDWLPVRIELSDATSNVDLHPLHYDSDGGAWQATDDDRFTYPANAWVVGRIGGRDVICLSAPAAADLPHRL